MATPVYVFDERDNIYRKWPSYSLIKTIAEFSSDYNGWQIVVGNTNDYIYGIGVNAVFKQSYGSSPITISIDQFVTEIFPYICAYDWSAKLSPTVQS